MEEPDEIPEPCATSHQKDYEGQVEKSLVRALTALTNDLLETGARGEGAFSTLSAAFNSWMRRDDAAFFVCVACIGLGIRAEKRTDKSLAKIAEILRLKDDPVSEELVERIDHLLPMMRRIEDAVEERGAGFVERVRIHREFRPERIALDREIRRAWQARMGG